MDPTEVVVNEPVTLNAGMPTECTRKFWMIKDIDPCMDRVARYRSNRHQDSIDAWVGHSADAAHYPTEESAQNALEAMWSHRIERAHDRALIEHVAMTRRAVL